MTKYNARKKTVDGITFDSIQESQYYLHLKEKQEKGEILAFNLQPKFTLQESFKKHGKTHRKIEYVADFEILHHDESIEIIDVKGFETADFKIKRKLFEKKYPFKLTLVKHVKKYGGWISTDEWRKRKKEEKKVKK
ncbi:DUF1064 domain-containing protein [Rossellomorea vietnamensis]|uniref:DUF1064 domain-containing protein n=1 Tax=Rossellomorea vietnamensis TaxID=218284 RepID=A0A5D4KFI2_9BACI|nr:DUF1064 domain-containing protein [Rossellomorea vietnamensis]TYR75570.1 DUF1064 domain-containing protein [Rossellomorea vietnamensis]